MNFGGMGGTGGKSSRRRDMVHDAISIIGTAGGGHGEIWHRNTGDDEGEVDTVSVAPCPAIWCMYADIVIGQVSSSCDWHCLAQ